MVSLWPWKRSEAPVASFEKALSSLSVKIDKASATRDGLRTRSRRLKVLWTLYTGFAYILCTLILTLVTGWRNWTSLEYAAVVGGPLIIYGVRVSLNSYYGYRLSSNQTQLESLFSQREVAIQKFKTATKYDTTQQLLEKYGAVQKTPPPVSKNDGALKGTKSPNAMSTGTDSVVQRTGLPPPPTANIKRPEPKQTDANPPQTDGKVQPRSQPGDHNLGHVAQQQNPPGDSKLSPGEEFAANAYPTSPQYVDAGQHGWYDKLVDLLLGEDETRAINRIALVCQQCRLVNGQAPPGAKSSEDIGRWRCMSCRAWNGVENPLEKLITEVSERANVPASAESLSKNAIETSVTQGVATNVATIENEEEPETE